MTNVTVLHPEIRAWAQKFSGRPQKMGASGYTTIRVDFPGRDDDGFLSRDKPPVNISWEEFFQIFEQQGLAFIYETDDVYDPSLAYHFIKRENLLAEQEIDERLFG